MISAMEEMEVGEEEEEEEVVVEAASYRNFSVLVVL